MPDVYQDPAQLFAISFDFYTIFRGLNTFPVANCPARKVCSGSGGQTAPQAAKSVRQWTLLAKHTSGWIVRGPAAAQRSGRTALLSLCITVSKWELDGFLKVGVSGFELRGARCEEQVQVRVQVPAHASPDMCTARRLVACVARPAYAAYAVYAGTLVLVVQWY